MLCPQCNTLLVGPTCPCGWVDSTLSSLDTFHEELPTYALQRIEPQEFIMGSPQTENGRDPDEVEHPVHINTPFAIGCTEVPQDLFMDIMGENPSYFYGERKPVDTVSWFEACAFCNAYSVAMKREPVYRFQETEVIWIREADGFRLPTEAEWELSARLAQAHAPLGTRAWFQDNAGLETHHVGQSHGISDMAGNVWEWVWDWYGPYPQQSIDPIGPKHGVHRVARGGSWADGIRIIRPANRAYQIPDHESNTIGFRLAQTLFPEEP